MSVTGAGHVSLAAAQDPAAISNLKEMAKGNAMLQSKLDAVLGESRKKQAEAMTTVEWRGKSLAVRSEQVLGLCV
jgi:hypothetical protein